MEPDIGNARTAAWVRHILSLNYPVKKAGEAEGFAERFRTLLSVGEPLDRSTRSLMEGFFGRDLSAVRIHRGYQAEETSRRLEARAFTYGGKIFASHRNLNASTKEGLGLLAHELTHVIQQVQPHQLPGVGPDSEAPASTREAGYAGATSGTQRPETVWLASSRSSSSSANPQNMEAQAQTNEKRMTERPAGETESPPRIEAKEIADRVYRLMQKDLVLERERATRLGG